MHYGTDVYDELLPVDEFLEDHKPASVRRVGPSNQLIVEATFCPAEPIIAVLNWK
jgi:hypothetical protein